MIQIYFLDIQLFMRVYTCIWKDEVKQVMFQVYSVSQFGGLFYLFLYLYLSVYVCLSVSLSLSLSLFLSLSLKI